jgi:hypothetical protein
MELKTMQFSLAAALVALGVSAGSAAAAKPVDTPVEVCNQATPHSLGGDLFATDDDPLPPARYKLFLKAHPGNGVGLENAASHSHALSLCGDDPFADDDGDGNGDDGGVDS